MALRGVTGLLVSIKVWSKAKTAASYYAGMSELADESDLKSVDICREGSSPSTRITL